MTRETKIGLLVAVGIILLIGIVISDHFAPANRNKPANLAQDVRELNNVRSPARSAKPGLRNRRNEIDRAVDANFGRRPARSPRRPNPLEVADEADPISVAMQQTRVVSDRPSFGNGSSVPPHHIEPGPDGIAELVLDRPVPTRPTSAPPTQYHTLQEHETLSDVAAKYLGSANKWQKIYAANKDRIGNPDRVRAGVRLKIPTRATAAPGPSRPAVSRPVEVARATTTGSYTIRKNETLSDIASVYYGSAGAWSRLYKLNKDRIANPDRIRAGTVIRVPSRRR
jgi:nucleoid-associated protein YgaU